ncbi:DUF418 domain-containing protein [Nocardiopsis sp. NPDC058789]|uniref:DUF418 domain-containing protein n=1 Tax=Nocardiopsis sp. NPDC058789 TaxID=3346634 RepID=UPI0036713395
MLVPDLARGTMLLLIAVANTHYWFPQDLGSSAHVERVSSTLLFLLVDARVYPLFSLLLGFGLAMVARGSVRAGLDSGLDQRGAERRTVALLRRRGMWLVVFGGVHALVFAQDILGVYGLVTILVAGIVTAHRWRVALALGAVVCALSTLFLLVAGPEAALTRGYGAAAQLLFEEGLLGVATSLALWVVVAPATALTSMVVPSVLLGAWLAGRGPIERPGRYRPRLAALVLVGLVVPVVVTPVLWAGSGGTGAPARVLVAWHQGLAGVLAGAACLALIALVASHRTAGTGVLGRALTATGRRALSAYLAQTVLMACTAGALRLGGVDSLALAWQLVVAVVVWSVSVLLCSVAERHGVRGPAERSLRQLVAGSPRG